MTTTTARARLVTGLATLALTVLAGPPSALAGGVVGTGSAASCTDAALNTALSGGGLVTFNCGSAPVTIDISPGAGGTGTKTIAADTTIDGGGVITISGANSVSVFSVNATGVKFTVRNLTIANGNSAGGYGGGIYNVGTLTVANSTLSGNHAGLGGGGIASFFGATLTIANSTFSGNSGDLGGGGISNSGTLSVTNSTFSGNSAGAGGFGGAIYNKADTATGPVTATITNSTFSGNGASGGGGDIYNAGGTLTVTNTIVANSASGGNCGGAAALTDGGHNIDDGTTCGFTGIGCTPSTGSSFCNTNPQLDPAGLMSNGGPTQTIALCTAPGTPASCTAASPAIDAGNQAVCAVAPVNDVDQRGLPRSFHSDAICDIGAFEVQHPSAQVPAVSPAGLIALILLLSAVGWLALRRSERM
jgi:hypothetical protein